MTNEQRAREFCQGAFGPFGVDVEPYTKIVAELLDGDAPVHRLAEFPQFTARVPDDIAEAAIKHMAEAWCVNKELTAETTMLVAELFAWCRTKMESGSRPIPIQAALEHVSEAMADPDGVGIEAKKGRSAR